MALLLRESDVERALDMDAVMESLAAAMRELGEGIAQNQPRRRVFPPGGVLNVMFASYPGAGVSGCKAYSVSGGKARFLVTVFDLEGRVVSLIEADRMGTFRTGAASGVAARALCDPGPKRVAVIGTGWQAVRQVHALARALEVSELRAFSRDPGRRARFASECGERYGVPARAADSAEAAVREADVVVTITTSAEPVLRAEWVAPGSLVIGAGSNFANRAELPPELIRNARSVVVDQLETAQLESGDLIQAEAAGAFRWSRAVELGAVLAGRPPLHEGGGPAVFESQGLALWDLAAAVTVLERARREGLGEEIRLF